MSLSSSSTLYIGQPYDKYTTAAAFKTAMSGVMLYYELATPTTSTETQQSLSLTTGSDTLSAPSFEATYEGTDYSIPLISNCKYIFRDSEGVDTLIQGTITNTSVDVTGGVNKLINLTHWFGRSKEPTLAAFYDLYPTWKNYDIPYDQGSVLNYKGTGVQTIGFNAYNHATGTAALLGGNQYQICGTFTSLSYVDVYGATETITLDSENRFIPVNNGILTVTGGNNTDTLVHLCWSGYKNFGKPEYKYEPFISNIKDFPVSTYFPDGMNGIGDVSDELTAEQKIQMLAVVRGADCTFTDYLTPNSTYTLGYTNVTVSNRKSTYNVFTTRYQTLGSGVASYNIDQNIISLGDGKIAIIDSSLIGLTGEQIRNRLSDMVIIYELSTPIITQLDQPLNLAYPVNDFGTEHSLPQNTTTLTTTDLKALIKYNTDYMRMNSQLAEIFPTVKSLAKQEQDGYIMKIDSYAPNARVGAADNLIDKNAEGTPAEFTFRTSGGTQNITDGTAIAKKIMGTTLNLNQLVKDSVEKTESSSTGVVEVSDAVAGDALALKMVAPRSVVVNQIVNNGNFTTTASWTGGRCTVSASNNILTGTVDSLESGLSIRQNGSLKSAYIKNHVYLIKVEFSSSKATTPHMSVLNAETSFSVFINSSTASYDEVNTWQVLYVKALCTIDTQDGRLYIYPYTSLNPYSVGNQFALKKCEVVDLTQYFNGDTALIDSITSWDDLVAYDPRFASYVEYNTGEVAGVQPQVKVSGKNLFDGVFPDISTVIKYRSIYVGNSVVTMSTSLSTTGWRLYFFAGQVTEGASSDNGVRSDTPRTVTPVNGYITIGYRILDNVSPADYNTQLELGSTATTYEPYHDGGTVQAPTPLFAVGTAADEFEVVSGVTTRKMASVDLGTLAWGSYHAADSNHPYGWAQVTLQGKKPGVMTMISSKYQILYAWSDKIIRGDSGLSVIYLVDSSLEGKTGTEVATAMSGTMLYYELDTPTTSTTTPAQISLQAGNNTAMQTDGGRTLESLSIDYVGTDYSIATKSSRKYVKMINGVTELVTGVSSVSVMGGRDNLIDLTRMFGAGLEPGTLDDFYSLFPAWNGYKLPYNKGSLLNYKGTGLKSVGFNLVDFGGRTLGAPQNTTYTNTTVRGPFDETKYYVGFSSNNYYLPSNVSSYEISESFITLKTSLGAYGVAFPIRVIPGQVYRCEGTYSGNRTLSFYTYNGTYISSTSVISNQVAAPSNAYWGLLNVLAITANTTYTWTNPCVHLQWSGTRNGDYEPYWDYTRPIPTLTYFPDGMNGRGDVYDEINPRQAVKRFAKVDLGTLTWTWLSSGDYGYWRSTVVADAARPSSSSVAANIIGELYTPVNISGLSGVADKVYLIGLGTDGVLLVNTGSTTISPTGWLVYELATPVVTTFPEEISATSSISDYGTEECIPVNGYDPVTTPFRGLVLYQDDYARTITKLPENYISKESMEALMTLLGSLHNGTFTMTFNQSTNEYSFNFTSN